jgi:hypothetical protein
VTEIKELRPYWLGDFYPLTEINSDEAAWAGWQLHRADLNAGFVMMFRRPKSVEPKKDVAFHGIDPHARYEVTWAQSFDPGPKQILVGTQLEHLSVTLSSPRSSVLIRYKIATANPE